MFLGSPSTKNYSNPPLLFSSPVQSPGRAFALPPASASTFTLKIFKSLYFPDHLINLVHIWYDDRYNSKALFSNIQAHYLKVKVMDLEIFNVKVFLRAHIFQIIWWILFIFGMMIDTVRFIQQYLVYAYNLNVKVTDFILKMFKSSYFPNHMTYFFHIWYDHRYRSKVLFSNTLCPCPWPQGQS